MTVGAPSKFVLPKPAPGGLTRRGLIKTGLGLTGLAGIMLPGTSLYAAMEAANGLSITDYRLTPPGGNMGVARIRQVVDAANALNCDLIVLLGDFFATHRFITEHVPPAAWAAELAGLRAPLGVHAILGNHDWWYDIAGTRAALAQVRIPVMENDAVLMGEGRRRFWLAGLGDQLAYPIGHRQFRGIDDLSGTLAKVTTADPVILLVHEPDIFTDIPARVSLTLAGHTHGGQIRLPLVPPFWAPSAYGARFAYGHIVEQGRHMIVSGGLGCSQVPLRLGVPPEIVRVTLG